MQSSSLSRTSCQVFVKSSVTLSFSVVASCALDWVAANSCFKAFSDCSIYSSSSSLLEAQRDIDRRLDDFARRLSAMEAKLPARKKGKWDGLMGQATVLACIVCGSWVLVTILNLFR